MENINWYEAFPSYLPEVSNTEVFTAAFLIWFSILAVSTACIGYVIFKTFQLIKSLQIRYVFLEVKPTDRALKSALSTTQLFTVLHSLEKPKGFIDRLLGIKPTISYELVSTKDDGIRYVLRVPESDKTAIKKTLLAYLPGIEIAEISDYLPLEQSPSTVHLSLGRNFLYPLQDQSTLNQHDPIAYLTAHMTKLHSGEMIALQCICSPVTEYSNSSVFHKAKNIRYSFLENT